MDANVHKCLVLVLEIGLACSSESPKERMNMEEVTKELHLIKNTFLGSRIQRGGLSYCLNRILNFCQMDPNVHKCLASILETGLACSMESSKDRMKMKEVTRELHLIKSAFLGSGISRGGFRRIQV
ncbi:hypothetical protein CFP56_011554 [Quercus suber]|uniref:Uncharacterized protein n=1 Tax=Quercus suber TaxID=58331 RepID=A0AAW0M3U9_QUESU